MKTAPQQIVGIEIIFFDDNKAHMNYKNCHDAVFLMQGSITMSQIKDIAKTLSKGNNGRLQVCKLYAAGRTVCKRALVLTDRIINLI